MIILDSSHQVLVGIVDSLELFCESFSIGRP